MTAARAEIIRDPLWNNIRVDDLTIRLVDTDVFQRLRYVRQLGFTYLVYPGATHTRFEHALGTYHLARLATSLLTESSDLSSMPPDECRIVCAAALLHDIGHYPFSHALEEIGALHHEDVARPLILEGAVCDLLVQYIGPTAPERIFALIRGRSASPLQGLISGSLDIDKIEYLKRDALMCGVPYGEIDVDRLLNSLVMVQEGPGGRPKLAVREKGLSALESLLFAKYQMYRNVYWHHAVRSATAMYKRLVEDALRVGVLDSAALAEYTDEGLVHHLAACAPSPLLDALRTRQLYKRSLERPAGEMEEGVVDWLADDRERVRAAENAMANELGLQPGELLLDFPRKEQMLGLDIALERRDRKVQRLTDRGLAGAINLPTLSRELYRTARWLRVFTKRGVTIPVDKVEALVARL
jgi:uncharacterized protein